MELCKSKKIKNEYYAFIVLMQELKLKKIKI